MDKLKFFNETANFLSVTVSILFVAGCAWFWYVILTAVDSDPLVKTIAITIVFFASLHVIYSIIRVNRFFLDGDNQRVGNTTGNVFINKTRYYLYRDIKRIDLRVLTRFVNSSLHNSSTSDVSKRYRKRKDYYAVLVLDENELYLQGSTNENETRIHVKQLSKDIGKPYYVNYHIDGDFIGSDLKISRILLLLTIVLACMGCLYYSIVIFQ